MKVLVVNCGSSSLKYQLFDMTDETVLAKGLVERIGIEGSILTHQPGEGDKVKIEGEIVMENKNVVIIKFSGVNTMNDAEKMKGKTLYTEKTPLPEGRYYIKDLIGLAAYENDVHLGELTDVFNTGANDIYEIKTPEGKRIYLPVIEGVIGDVDLENKTIAVTIPAGLLDNDDEE